MRLVGLISDTHGLIRPQALDALRGSDLILHAGDVGKPEIIDALGRIARTVAIRGNVDVNLPALPNTALIKAGSAMIYVVHDVHAIEIDPTAKGVQIVVSGHSHKPSQAEGAGVLYINPGSAGPRRFHLPVCIATLDLNKLPLTPEFIELKV